MSRVAIILKSPQSRAQARLWVDKAPDYTRFELKESRRTLPQNAKFWAALTDVARQVTWHGVKLSTDDWRLVFLDALKLEMRIVPNVDGTGFVQLGRSSSDLSVQEMSDLLEVIHAFGANHGVKFNDISGDQGGGEANKLPAEVAA
jgi:hypothetical protein